MPSVKKWPGGDRACMNHAFDAAARRAGGVEPLQFARARRGRRNAFPGLKRLSQPACPRS